MKFLIVRSDEKGKTVERITGFKSLVDACTAAHALARSNHGAWFYHVRLAKGRFGEHLDGISPRYAAELPLERLVAGAEKELIKVKKNARDAKARHKWLAAHGGFDMLWPVIQKDDAIREAFFKNDFAPLQAWITANPSR